MTTTTTPQINAPAARRLLGNIERDLRNQLRRTKDHDPLELLLSRARHVINIGLIPSRPDGWPASTPLNGSPGGSGGRAVSVPDEHGQPDRVPVTSTEAAALFTRPESDPAKDIAREVLAELATLQASLSALGHALDRFDNIRNRANVPDAPQCYVASVMYRLPWDTTWEPGDHSTTLGGLLPDEHKVCKFVYNFHQRERRLPTRDEMVQHGRRGTVRLRSA